MLQEGTVAPDFSGIDHTGAQHHLADYSGKWLLLYFYPKDDTPGCTKEACLLGTVFVQLQASNAAVLGVSKDTAASHQKFAAKYDLPFPLLADTDQTIIRAYEARGVKKMFGKSFEGTLRISYLINPEGKIAKAYPKVNPAKHALDVLNDIQELQHEITRGS